MMKKLWNDEVGALVSAEIVLVATILVIGVVTGLAAVRDAVVTELGDVASAIGSVDQTYSVGGTTGHHAGTVRFSWNDAADDCDESCAQIGTASACISVCTTGKGGEDGAGAVGGN
jgi:hypothetical protein